MISFVRDALCGGSGAESACSPATRAADRVLASVATLRRDSAVIFGAVRVASHLCLLGAVGLASQSGGYRWMAGIEIAGALGAVLVLGLLVTRKSPFAIGLGAAIDWSSLALGAWLDMHGLTPFTAATVVVLISTSADLALVSAALTLPAGAGAVLSGAVVSAIAFWAFSRGLATPVALAVTAHVLLLALAMARVGWQVTRVAARRALAEYDCEIVHADRNELDAVNRRLEEANARLRERQRRTETLAQLVVHDLRNPLSAVLASLDLVVERIPHKPGLSEEHADLSIASAEARRLGSMLNDLLILGRLESGEFRLAPEATRVRVLLDATAQSFRPAAALRRIYLEVEADENLVATFDAKLIRRLLDNLLSNALRHTAAGDRIQLTASSEGASLRIAVRNSGAPLSSAARAHLFEKHATGSGPPLSNFGLGLYLCQLVARSHHGTIGVVERPGWSVSFETVFPTAPRPAAGDSAQSASGDETSRCVIG